MERVTKYNQQLNCYELADPHKKLTEKNLIFLLGKREDWLEKLSDRSGSLIKSMMDLLEITKGEKEDLVKKIEGYRNEKVFNIKPSGKESNNADQRN